MNDARMRDGKCIAIIGSLPDSLISFRGPLLQRLVANGHRVVACAPKASPDVVRALEAMGVTYRDIPFERAGMRPDRDLHALRSLVSVFGDIKPDVMLGYTIKPVIYGLIAAGLAGVPRRYAMITGLGYTFIGSSVKARLVGLVTRQLYRLALRKADRVFFQNPDDVALFEELGLIRSTEQVVMVNGSGVDLKVFQPAPFTGGNPSFLLIARLLEDKGIREYVAAARLVRATYPLAEFHLVGWLDKGNPAGISEEELQSWEDEGVLRYHGQLDDVRPVIAASSVYVLPSYREGTPRTVLEAMAMGRPVVTTDAPGCRETVRDGENGFLVPVKEVEGLAEAMMRFVEDPSLIATMGNRSREVAEQKYDAYEVSNVVIRTMGLAA